MEGGGGSSLVPSAPPFPQPQVERPELGGVADLDPLLPSLLVSPPRRAGRGFWGTCSGILRGPSFAPQQKEREMAASTQREIRSRQYDPIAHFCIFSPHFPLLLYSVPLSYLLLHFFHGK